MDTKTPAEQALELKTATAEARAATLDLKALFEKAKGPNAETSELKSQLAEQEKKYATLESNLTALHSKLGKANLEGKNDTPQTLAMVFKAALDSPVWKDGVNETMAKEQSNFSMEVKVPTTANVTTPIANSQLLEGIGTIGRAPNSLLDLFITSAIPQDKNRIAYREASFLDNSGYVSELAKMATANTAKMEEKYRSLAKVGSFMPFSTEMLEDNSELVSWATTEGMEAIRYRLNGFLDTGIGADGGANATKIYGLKTTGVTAFSAALSGLAGKVENPNIADIVKAAIVQIKKQGKGRFIPTHVVMSIDDLAILDTMKDTNGQPLVIRGYDGTPRLHGLTVVEDIERTQGEGYVVTQRTLQLKEKRGFSVEIERNADKDGYTFYIRWRGQALIRDIDKMGNVSFNTSTDLAKIAKTIPTT